MVFDMDGVEVCRTLRVDPTTTNVSILMLTAKSTPSEAVTGLRAGADDYIMKPFDPEELLAWCLTVDGSTGQLGDPPNARLSRFAR